jgi:hypothetical protein
MAATTYTDSKEYMKFQKEKSTKGCGCENKDTCSCEEECSCCPVGTVALYDDAGHHIGCLTPNDAELYEKNTHLCEQGFVKLIRTSDGEFLGCVSEDKYAELYEAINPPA